MKFGQLNKGTVFIKNKRWYKKTSPKNNGKTILGIGVDENGRLNFFGNNQKVKKYEFR